MTPKADSVKAARRYDTAGRRDRAHRAHAQILTVARELFLRDGYAATTVAKVAAVAGVSVETIYKTFRGKPGLVRAIQRSALAGVGPVPAPERSDEMSAQDLAPRAILRNWATLTTEVMPRVAPIILLVRAAAATDLDMGRLLGEINEERLQRMHHNASRLADHGPLRAGMSTEQARDVMFAYTAPELYEILVDHQRWPIDHYGDFIYRGLIAELLDDDPPHRPIPNAGSVRRRSSSTRGAGLAGSGR